MAPVITRGTTVWRTTLRCRVLSISSFLRSHTPSNQMGCGASHAEITEGSAVTGRWDQKIDALNETAVLTELFALIALEAPLTGRILPHDAHHAGKASIPKACEMYVRRWSELHVQRANATNPLKTKALQPSGADLRSVRNSLVEKFCYQHSCKRAQPGEPRSAMICAAR